MAAVYRQTGMARSFTAFDPAKTSADFSHRNRFEHAASGRIYTMTLRDGIAYMRRHERDAVGREINVVEKRGDYIIGSGHKAQTLLHRTTRGELVEMPVAWYTANGGYWAMNPGYDRPDHAEFRRPIRYDCFFCHNAYSSGIADDGLRADALYPAQLPSGIDCQRCHGPGSLHVESASAKAPIEAIRAAIVNPKRLPRERQLEVCYQCHLQSTSTPLPHVVTKLGRGIFSYRAGEPLAGYALFFDHPSGIPSFDDKFEIAHAAYRLRQSACFKASQMTCTTCHDPHKAESAGSRACRSCHAQPIAGAMHARATECISCHMPQRRTDDVVEVVMTDHRITRLPPPPAALTARKTERHGAAYRVPVSAYYPANPDALHMAVAQVRVGANLAQGAAMLEAQCRGGGGVDCYSELADAQARQGDTAKALQAAERAFQSAPENPWLLRSHGSLLGASGDLARSAQLLEKARGKLTNDPATLHALALTYRRQDRAAEALGLLEQAARVDPDSVDVQFTLGEIRFERGDAAGAAAAFRQAILAKPDYGLAHFNLAAILIGEQGNEAEGFHHLGRAAALVPGDPRVRHKYGVALASRNRFQEAARELEAALRLDPASARSQLALGMVLLNLGQPDRARDLITKAAASSADPAVREQALRTLQAAP